MLEHIKKELDRIEDGLWLFAKEQYGLERTNETLARIQLTISRVIGRTAKPESASELSEEEVAHGLAIAFLAIGSARLYENDHEKIIGALSAASEAAATVKITAVQIRMYEELFSQINNPDLMKKTAATQLAKLRHAESRLFKEYAVEYWRENIDPNLSASKAAGEIFTKRIVNLSYKTIAEVIAKEKKKLP